MQWSECWIAQDIDDRQLRTEIGDLCGLRLEDFQGWCSISELSLEALDINKVFLQ